jgi:hypothetical protein
MSLLDILRESKIARYLRAIRTESPQVYDGEHWDLRENGCPDCRTKPFNFYEGPSGGISVNVCCTNPLCRSAFWMTYGQQLDNSLRRIPNTVFRGSFPECPEESEAYIRAEELKRLNDESTKFINGLEGGKA